MRRSGFIALFVGEGIRKVRTKQNILQLRTEKNKTERFDLLKQEFCVDEEYLHLENERIAKVNKES